MARQIDIEIMNNYPDNREEIQYGYVKAHDYRHMNKIKPAMERNQKPIF